MLSLPFRVLMNHYPRKRQVDHDALFREIGWDDLIKNPSFENTCAMRVSLALIRCGVAIPDGRMPIKTGPHKGKLIEPGQAKLSHILARASMFGNPEKFGPTKAVDGIGSRSGVVSFWHLIPGLYEGGHIDLVSPDFGGVHECGSGCHWTSGEIWFWPLK